MIDLFRPVKILLVFFAHMRYNMADNLIMGEEVILL